MFEPDKSWQQMIATARRAADNAYCRYSSFPVGAAVRTPDGRIFSGCNVENASYGLTICAERVAIFQAVAAGQTRIDRVAVYTPTPTPTAPCGACRQVVSEFGPEAEVLSTCATDQLAHYKLAELLPYAFGPANLTIPQVPRGSTAD